MSAQTAPFKEICFTGGRFEDTAGWLDVETLSELQFYRKLILAVAGERWRQQCPERERLPRGYAETFRLGISAVSAGSAVAVMRRIAAPDSQLPLADDFAEAAQIIDDILRAVRDNEPFPSGLTAAILPMFAHWGKTLRPEESMVLGRGEHSPVYNFAIKERLLERISGNEPYIDELDLVGEVRAADLSDRSGGSFRIRLASGDAISGDFTDEQEAGITEALRNHSEVHLRLSGQGRFEPSGKLQRILRVDYHEVLQVGETLTDYTTQSILEMFDEIHRSMPDGAFDEFPTDGAANLKHYLYGWPKGRAMRE